MCSVCIWTKAYYIPDFYCHEAKLVIEADSPIHDFKKGYDKNRDEVMVSLGLSILRFSNDDIINQTQKVLDEIAQYIKNYPSLSS